LNISDIHLIYFSDSDQMLTDLFSFSGEYKYRESESERKENIN